MTPHPATTEHLLAIEARGLRKVFTRGSVSKVAVDGIDLNVAAGRIFGLIGPNGAGKSTLVSMLATLMRPTEGEAWIMGHSILHDARAARQALSFNASAGERGFYWRLNAYQNLEFFAALQGLDAVSARERTRWCLERVGLAPDTKLRFGEFSSGMKRRLNVARALLVDRPIYLFDEPTSGVDPHSGETIRAILRDVKAAGKTVVLVTHNMEEATQLCDEVGMLYAGRMIRHDKPEVIRRLVPTTEIEVELGDLGAATRVTERLLSLPVVENVVAQGEGRLRVRTAEPEEDVRGLLLWAASDDLPIAGVTVVRPELSDAFVRLVEEATGHAPEQVLTAMAAPSSVPMRRRPPHR